MYADNTKIIRIDSVEDCKQLESDLNHLMNWTHTWLMKFNTSKCKTMHVGSRNECWKDPVKEDDHFNDLEQSLEEKDWLITS